MLVLESVERTLIWLTFAEIMSEHNVSLNLNLNKFSPLNEHDAIFQKYLFTRFKNNILFSHITTFG